MSTHRADRVAVWAMCCLIVLALGSPLWTPLVDELLQRAGALVELPGLSGDFSSSARHSKVGA